MASGENLARQRCPRVLRVGMDFAGCNAPLIALKNMGITVRHMFDSDANADCRLISSLNGAEQIFDDVKTRDVGTTLPTDYIAVARLPALCVCTIYTWIVCECDTCRTSLRPQFRVVSKLC